MNYKYILSLIVCFSFFQLSSQVKDTLKKQDDAGFHAGDIILNVNYGYPQVTPAILRTAIKVYYRIVSDETMSFSVTNSGVFNAKTEYGINENLGLGLVSSYWNMNVLMQNNYNANGNEYQDDIKVKLSALAFGVRGNYHFNDEVESRFIDPYSGITIGTTYYGKDVQYTSTNPERQIPEEIPKKLYEFKSGWATYFSTTIGVRLYPVKYVGINLELGWDRGACLFGGVVIKIPTKPIKAFTD